MTAIHHDFASPTPVDGNADYGEACAKGRDHADKIIQKMCEKQQPTLLWWTVQGLSDDATAPGFRIGFFHRIAEKLMAQN